MTYFVVTMEHGAAWDDGRGIREQAGWDAHADFMDALVDEGFVVLGGPLGDGHRALLVVEAPDDGRRPQAPGARPLGPDAAADDRRTRAVGDLARRERRLDQQGAGGSGLPWTGTAPRPDAPVKSAWPLA